MTTTTARPQPPTTRQSPTVANVYRALDGALHHARCRQRMSYQGATASWLELQFYCAACHERVILPEFVVTSLPVATTGAA